MPSMGRFDLVSIRKLREVGFWVCGASQRIPKTEAPQEFSDRFLSIGKG
jgi:hypothetical protein